MINRLINKQTIIKKVKSINIPLVVMIAILVLEVIFFIYYRNTWYDEAKYQYNSWAIYQFGWLPYQDVWLKLPPLVYYIFGLPQYLFGPSLYVGRITAAVFLFLGAWLMYKIAKRLSGSQGAFWSLVFLALTPFLVSNYVSGTVYSLVFFFVMAAFWFLLSSKKSHQIVFPLLFLSLAVLVRQNLAPLLIIIFIYLLITIKGSKFKYYILFF